jgi:hypothetical protein
MPCVVSRWQGVLSKYPWSASETNEATVQGAAAASRLAVNVPTLVSMVTGTELVAVAVVAGGLTFLAEVPARAHGHGVPVESEAVVEETLFPQPARAGTSASVAAMAASLGSTGSIVEALR